MRFSFLTPLLIILMLLTSSIKTSSFSDTNARITDELIHEICSRTRNPSICLNTLDSLRGSRLFPKPLVVLGMAPMSMAQSHANRTAASIWDQYRGTADPRMFKLRRRYYNCVLNYADAMKQLNKAKKLMLAGEARSVRNYTLLAVHRVDSCDVELVKPLMSEANRKFLQANMKFKDLCDIIMEICNKVSG